ncbi:MAG TPA: hypothetical protein PLV21_03525 [Cyclobacteriaceae bacterium]|nr:hypothetical protein [Cyclobacteriaceae bacterium]HRJ80928.1 hypothetical protein [Cyclobacteriaceae bacterium]
MKTSKSNLSAITIIVFVLFLIGTISSCGTKSSTEETAEQTHEAEEAEGHEHDSEEAEHHDHDEASANEGSGSIMWMPSGQPFSGQLKLVEGDAQKLNAETSTDSDGTKVLSLSLSGDRVLLLFYETFEDLGSNLQFKTDGFQGQVAIVHHYIDASNYDYLSLTNTSMQLGRKENGKDKIFDKKENKLPGDWATLTVSSAGEHYKGSLNGKLVNHGHGKTKPGGRVGILLEGNGKVMLKMMEVMKLTE